MTSATSARGLSDNKSSIELSSLRLRSVSCVKVLDKCC